MRAGCEQHIPNFRVQLEPMLVVQLRHAAWRRPPCRMEQKVPSFYNTSLVFLIFGPNWS